MKIDFSTLAFGYNIGSGGGTPNWATPLGQARANGYPIREDKPGINELLRGMIRCHVPAKQTKLVWGRGAREPQAGDSVGSPLVLAASFSDVYVVVGAERVHIDGKRLNLFLIEDDSVSHQGRLQLKYSPKNTYVENSENNNRQEWTNDDLYKGIAEKLHIQGGCWFVSDISIENQRIALLTVHIVSQTEQATYGSPDEQHAAWAQLAPGCLNNDDTDTCKPGENVLLYGIPGSGKSHKIRSEYCDDDNLMERIVFHPDYTYSDFVGQILPDCHDHNVEYKFIPGPFTRILKKAHGDPNSNYYLIIEELNRGNAPAIFGDIFQLLDRAKKKDLKDHTELQLGDSVYTINNEEIAKEVYGNPEHPIRLPHNLYVLATMNTSDQNVFTLDTAFKRRWRMRNVKSVLTQELTGHKIASTEVTWGTFLGKINEQIASLASEGLAGEDKRLGAYFADEEDMDDPERFAEKVLMYLWTDVFKNCPERVFKPGYRTLEELVDGFIKEGFGVFKPEVGLPATPPQVPPAAPAAGARG